MRRFVAALTALTLAPVLLAEPIGQEQFRVGVDVKHVQVGVHDADGDFVPGLSADDFVLRVNGVEREILTAWTIDSDAPADSWIEPVSAAAAASVAEPVSEVRTPPRAARRRFVFFVDLTLMPPVGLRNTRRLMRTFLDEHVREADMLAAIAYSPVAGLRYLVPFTSDHAQVRAAVDDLTGRNATERVTGVAEAVPLDAIVEFYANAGGPGGGGGGSEVTDFVQELEESHFAAVAESMLDALRELARSLSTTDGRKHVLMFSYGLPDMLIADYSNVTDAMESFALTAQGADVVFHTFHPGNVGGGGGMNLTSMNPFGGGGGGNWAAPPGFLLGDRSALWFVAEETGGSASFWRWGVKRGMRDVQESTNDYYVLAFPLREGDGAEIDLEIESRRPEVEVAWAPRTLRLEQEGPRTEFQRQFEVADALELGAARGDLVGDVRAWIMPSDGEPLTRVALSVKIAASSLEAIRAERPDGALDLEVLGMTVSPDRLVHDYFSTRARSELGGAAGESLQPFRFTSWLRAAPGRHYVKIMVRDQPSGRMFTRSLAIRVPDAPPAGLRIEPLIAVLPANVAPMGSTVPWSTIRAGKDTVPNPFRVNAIPLTYELGSAFRAGEEIAAYAAVHGVSTAANGDPAVGLSALLLDGAGGLVPIRGLSVIVSEWDAARELLHVVVRLPIPAAAPLGAHELQLTAADSISGQDARATMPLSLSER